jgi:hypothetical protein
MFGKHMKSFLNALQIDPDLNKFINITETTYIEVTRKEYFRIQKL